MPNLLVLAKAWPQPNCVTSLNRVQICRSRGESAQRKKTRGDFRSYLAYLFSLIFLDRRVSISYWMPVPSLIPPTQTNTFNIRDPLPPKRCSQLKIIADIPRHPPDPLPPCPVSAAAGGNEPPPAPRLLCLMRRGRGRRKQ